MVPDISLFAVLYQDAQSYSMEELKAPLPNRQWYPNSVLFLKLADALPKITIVFVNIGRSRYCNSHRINLHVLVSWEICSMMFQVFKLIRIE